MLVKNSRQNSWPNMSGNSGKKGKKRPKSYYLKCSQQNKRKINRLEIGIRGFLLTCNSHEKDATREAYNLLNEYADQIYGPEEVPKDETKADDGGPEVSSEEDEEEEDIEAALQKEVKAIKTTISSSQRRFQSVQTKAHNCLFIKTSLADPCQLAHTIFTDLAKNHIQKTRYALRFLPIAGTCRAYQKDLKELAEKLLVEEFQTPFGVGLKYSVIYKSRNNNNNDLARTSVQMIIGQVIKTLNPLHSVNFDNPDVVVVVEVIGNICCLGTARDFMKFRKYNLVEVVRSPVETKENKKDVDVEKSVTKPEAANNDFQKFRGESSKATESKSSDNNNADEKVIDGENNFSADEHNNVQDSSCQDKNVVDESSSVVSNIRDDNITEESRNLVDNNSTDDNVADDCFTISKSDSKDDTAENINKNSIAAENGGDMNTVQV
ncbi:THUMP domain-containing protein 1-like [Ylistrum balloti]|uniref:THUMP domain-containing protein 1-like n=1 Tax=Ylistrum balloti TaxID=509963 RepID=UPI002905F0D7|nr:THUMP domain-containing protein 1-like [Ylistrum balloti]